MFFDHSEGRIASRSLGLRVLVLSNRVLVSFCLARSDKIDLELRFGALKSCFGVILSCQNRAGFVLHCCYTKVVIHSLVIPSRKSICFPTQNSSAFKTV